MEKIFIDYGQRINTAILGVIKDILKDLSESKISSNHCFYISFKTKDKDVDISSNLLKEYPNEMTIVLQNQYWDLDVKKNSFSVTLSFNKKKETLELPFRSITKFYDPFVKKLKVEHFICFGTILKTHFDFNPYVDLVLPLSIF